MKTSPASHVSSFVLTPRSWSRPDALRHLLGAAAIVALVALAGTAAANQQNWAGPGGTPASPTSGLWDTTTANWDAGVVFTNGNGAVFGGPNGTYFIQCGANLTTVTNITFNASGYTLTNDTTSTISLPGNNASVVVASGKTATIGTNVTVSGGGNPFLFNPGANNGGTLTIDNGGTLQQQNNQPLNIDGAPGSTIRVLTGGILRHGGNGSNLRVGLTANASPTISLEGGQFICTGGSSFGSIILAAANSSTSAVTIASGLLRNPYTGNSANGSLNLGNGAPGQVTVSLDGGVLALGNLRKTSTSSTTLSALNFNGGTLQAASASGAPFIPSNLANVTANVRNNNSTIDNNGFAITIGQPLVHSTIAGDAAVDGGLTFTGSGTTTITATNTYTGPTIINSGTTLSLNGTGVIDSSSAVAVNGSLILTNRLYSNSGATFSMSNGTLYLNNINFPTNVVTGTLATDGSANLINFSAVVGPAGQLPVSVSIIKYTTLAPGVVDGANNLTTLALGSLPTGFAGYLTNNVSRKTIDLVVTQGQFTPQITSQPVSTTRYKGFNVQFNVTAIGASGYQWQRYNGSSWANLSDGGNIVGSGSNVLTLAAVTLAQAADYRVLATNLTGTTISDTATLTVLDYTGYGGTNALLSPLAYYRLNETGDPINTPNLPAYDWVGGLDGCYGNNALNAAYGIVGPQAPDYPGFESGNGAAEFTRGYPGSWMVVSNGWQLNTNTVTLLAWIKPQDAEANATGLIVQRSSAAPACGLTYSDSTDSAGNYTLGYNWNNDGNAYFWDSKLVAPIGQWSLVALVVSPTNATIYLGNTSGLAASVHTLNHAAQQFPGPIFIGADPFASSRTFNGDIDEVSVFGRCLSYNEVLAALGAGVGTTNFPPTPLPMPATVTNFQYQTQQLTVQAFGSGTLGYKWQKAVDNVYVDLDDDSRISGAHSATLVISNLALSDTADYVVIITNSVGSVTSSVTHLTVNPVLGPATNITSSVVQQSGNDWDTASTWAINGVTQTEGATLLAEEYSSGPGQGSTFFISPAGAMRTPAFNNPSAPTTATFPGDVLVVQGNGTYDPNITGAAGSLRLKGGNPATVNFKKLVMAGGQLVSILNSGWPAIIDGGEMNVISNTVIWAADDSGLTTRAITIQSKLTGSGTMIYHAYTTLTTFQTASTAALNIANANNTFTGAWAVQQGTLVGSAANALGTNTITVGAQGALQTTYALNNPNADLVLNGRMYLTQNDTFRSVTVNGTMLSAGTHSFSELAANYPAHFPSSWTGVTGATGATTASGSITVLVGPSDPGTVQLVPGGSTGWQITWTNASVKLLSATNVLGPWGTIPGAHSPYPLTNDAPQKFFKLQQ